jgi:hypothetical protein
LLNTLATWSDTFQFCVLKFEDKKHQMAYYSCCEVSVAAPVLFVACTKLGIYYFSFLLSGQ